MTEKQTHQRTRFTLGSDDINKPRHGSPITSELGSKLKGRDIIDYNQPRRNCTTGNNENCIPESQYHFRQRRNNLRPPTVQSKE